MLFNVEEVKFRPVKVTSARHFGFVFEITQINAFLRTEFLPPKAVRCIE